MFQSGSETCPPGFEDIVNRRARSTQALGAKGYSHRVDPRYNTERTLSSVASRPIQYDRLREDTMHADSRFEQVRAAIEQIGPADHVCTLYERRDEELAIAVSYIRAGLDRSELCVCVVDDGGESILNALASEGVDIDAEMRKGRLAIFEKPLAQGLQTRDMLGKIEQYARESRMAGHAGFRIVGEMTWALDG